MSGKITAIERTAEGLPLTVYVDGRPVLEVSDEVADRLGLKVGMELSAAAAPSVVVATGGTGRYDESVKVRESALRLLAVRARSVRELHDRLTGKGFCEEVVSETLEGLVSVGLLDDRAFARMWSEERVRLRPVGPLRLRQELLAKGVPGDVVGDVVRETYVEHDELELAVRAIGKRARGSSPSPREAARLNAFLLRRGFSYGTASLALRMLRTDRDTHGAEDDADSNF